MSETTAVTTWVDDSDLRKTVKATLFAKGNDAEMTLFLHECRRCGVHPMDRMIVPAVFEMRNGERRYTSITTIDLLRARAGETGEHAGTDDAVFVVDDDGRPVLASVTVYRMVQGHRFAYTASARWDEYNIDNEMWARMRFGQLAKCAEALALRKAFPRQLAKLYTTEETDRETFRSLGDIVTHGNTPRAVEAGVDRRQLAQEAEAAVEALSGGGTEPAATEGTPDDLTKTVGTLEWMTTSLGALRLASASGGDNRRYFEDTAAGPALVDADLLRACGRVDGNGNVVATNLKAALKAREKSPVWDKLVVAVKAEYDGAFRPSAEAR